MYNLNKKEAPVKTNRLKAAALVLLLAANAAVILLVAYMPGPAPELATVCTAAEPVFVQHSRQELFPRGRPALVCRFDLRLSHNNNFYKQAINVEITSPVEGAKIRYTLNGADPTPERGREYAGPVHVPVSYNRALVLKAVAYTDDAYSHVLTHTYFVHPDIDERFTTLVFSITTDPRNLYDYDHGIFVAGRSRDEWIAANPGVAVQPHYPANFNMRGREWERPAYTEVLTEDGTLIISQSIGIRAHGGWSRAHDRKPIRLVPRWEYDPNFGMLIYDFFPGDKRHDEYESTIREYYTLVLHHGGTDRWNFDGTYGAVMREEFSQRLAQQAGILWARNNRPASVFINGEYYGVAWLQERVTYGRYIANKLGGGNTQKQDIEIFTGARMPRPENIEDDKNFREYAEIMDLDNFMIYYAFQIYIGNYDWPNHNERIWRYIGEYGIYYSKYYDGKYRMLLNDLDMTWGRYAIVNGRTIRRLINERHEGWAGYTTNPTFAILMQRDDMVEKFCNQMFDLINTVFVYENVRQVFDGTVEEFDAELRIAMRTGVPQLPNEARLAEQRNRIVEFAERRAEYMILDMVESFGLNGATYGVRVNGHDNATVKLNTLISENNDKPELYSTYFTEHRVNISCVPDPGYKFDYWEINGVKFYEPTVTLSYNGAANINAAVFVSIDDAFNSAVIDKIYTCADNSYIIISNITNREITVSGLYFSNSSRNLALHSLENITLAPDSSLTVADLPFSLQAGCTLYISDSGGILQQFRLPDMSADEILARKPNGEYRVTAVK